MRLDGKGEGRWKSGMERLYENNFLNQHILHHDDPNDE